MPITEQDKQGRDLFTPYAPLNEEVDQPFGGYWRHGINPFAKPIVYKGPPESDRLSIRYLNLLNAGWPITPVFPSITPDLTDANQMVQGIDGTWFPESPGHLYGDFGVLSWCSAANFSARYDLTLYTLPLLYPYGRIHSFPSLRQDFPSPFDFNDVLESLYARTVLHIHLCEQAIKLSRPAGHRAPH